MTRLTIEGRLTAAGDRRLRGRLVPYGSPGYTNMGRVVVNEGGVQYPDDVSTLFASLDHLDGRDPVAEWVGITPAPDGLWAEWDALPTHGGDKLLAEFHAGTRTGISVELEPVSIRDGVAAGTLIGCAFPPEPAFSGARLVAELAPDDVEYAAAVHRFAQTLYYEATPATLDADPVMWDQLPDDERARYITAAQAAIDLLAPAAPDTPPDQAAPDDTPAPLLASSTETPGEEVAGSQEGTSPMTTAAPAAAAPAALLAGAATGPTTPAAPPANVSNVRTPHEFFRLLAAAHSQVGAQRARLLAALSDVVPADVVDSEQPAWVGEMWSGVAYQRRFVPLINNAPLTGLNMEGWRWVTKPEVDVYAGNKAAVPSNDVDTEPVTKAATRWAGAHDIDRAFRDFGNAAFFAAYYAAMTESYARKSDLHIPGQLKAGATIVTAGAVPSGVSVAMAAIVDGALAVLDKGLPSFAIVEKSIYRSLLLTPKDAVLEYLSSAMGLESGELGGFRIVPTASTAVGDASSTTGLDVGEVLVGIRNAATFYELGGGTPIRAEAVDMVNGGIDAGVFGYGGVIVHDSEGLALIDTDADSA
jgi:hypothetical protein